MVFSVSDVDAIFSAAAVFTLRIFYAAFNTKSTFIAKLSTPARRTSITLFTKEFRCTFYAMCSFSAIFAPVFTMRITFRTVFPRFQTVTTFKTVCSSINLAVHACITVGAYFITSFVTVST